jgi:peptidoglycan/xylan/chitin deacetylase (PgdA/CDA1 family)
MFERVFSPDLIQIRARGNVLAATAFLYGLSCEEVDPAELERDDSAYPVIVTVRAVKETAPSASRSPDTPRRGSAILLYHRVSSRTDDVHGMAVSPDAFRAQLDHLCRQWRPTRLETLAEASVRDEPPEGTDGSIALTFDDGYLDNLECAARILEEFEVPATFFLTTERLNRPRLYWWDSLEAIFLTSPDLPATTTVRIDGVSRTFHTADRRQRRAAHDDLYLILKASPPAVRDDLIRQLSRATAVTVAPDDDRPILADEVRALARFPLVDVGAHSVHHMTLPSLSAEDLHREIFECRSELERTLGRAVSLFAYPFGDTSAETTEMVRAADYRFAVGCEPRGLRPGEHPYRLPRLEPPKSGGSAFADWLSQHARPSTDVMRQP